MKERNESEEPNRRKSSTDMADPTRLKDRIDSEDPRCVEDMSDRLKTEPMRVKPKIETVEPTRA